MPISTKELLYTFLRDAANPKKILISKEIIKFLKNLSAENTEHMHAVTLLDEKIDLGEQRFLCELIAQVWSKKPKSLPKAIASKPSIMQVINAEQNTFIFNRAHLARHFRAKNIPNELIEIIFAYADDENDPINSIDLKKTIYLNENQRRLCL